MHIEKGVELTTQVTLNFSIFYFKVFDFATLKMLFWNNFCLQYV